MSNLKVKGKVSDWCTKCKNCKSTTRQYDGKNDIRIIEVECEDPYDGMVKTLNADSDICCSMFKPESDQKCCCENVYFMPSQVNAMIDDVKRQKDIERNAAVNGLKIQIKQLELGYEELECKIKDLTDTNNKLMERNVELVAQCDETYEKFRDCERVLHDILNEVYEHPEMFERNMTAYELLPGRVKTLKDSWDMMCDKYDPLNIENEQRKKAMDNQAKMIQDIKKERDEITEKLKNSDISKVPICKEILNGISELKDRNEELEKKLNAKNKDLDILLDENKSLKLRNDNQVTMIQGLKLQYNDLSEKLKRVESHDKALTKHFQNDEKLIDSIQKVIFPQEEGSDYTYSYEEILNKVKELKVQSDKDKTMDKVMYEDLEYWKKRCHEAETDVMTLNSKVEVLDKRNTNQFVMIGEKDKEIENLKKMVERRDKWVEEFKSDVDTLQNEILTIRNIAQKAYDDTNRD